MKNNLIKSVKQYINFISNFNEGKYIYRGQSNSKYLLESGAKRRIKKFCKTDNVDKEMFEKYHKSIIVDAKNKGFDFFNNKRCSFLELLTNIQHFHGATLLIDFSKNPLIALFFSVNNLDEENNGVVYYTQIDTEQFIRLDFLKDYNEFTAFFNFITSNDDGMSFEKASFDMIRYCEPPYINERISVQNSIFIIDQPNLPNGVFKEIIIDKKSKKRIKYDLKRLYGIEAISLYNDLQGYSENNSAVDPYDCPNDNDKIFQKAIDLFQKQEYDKALMELEILQNFKKDIPKDISDLIGACYLNIGNKYLRLKLFKNAIINYNKALEINKSLHQIYLNLCEAKTRINDYEGALNDINKYISLYPNDSRGYTNRGLIYYYKGDFENAISDLNKSLIINPNSANILMNISGIYNRKKQYDEAYKYLIKALSIDNNNPTIYYNLAKLKMNKNDLTNSLEYINKAIELDNKYSNALTTRGILLYKEGHYNAALNEFNNLIDNIQYKSNLVYYYRTLTYFQLGEISKSKEDIINVDLSDPMLVGYDELPIELKHFIESIKKEGR